MNLSEAVMSVRVVYSAQGCLSRELLSMDELVSRFQNSMFCSSAFRIRPIDLLGKNPAFVGGSFVHARETFLYFAQCIYSQHFASGHHRTG